MADSFSWKCPYCNQNATITNANIGTFTDRFNQNNKDGLLSIVTDVVVCPNILCREYTISFKLCKTKRDSMGSSFEFVGEPLLSVRIKPQSAAKPFPSYIPSQIIQDYIESCLISSLSPKASATLSRRCLQGMIRDFWKISKKSLFDEINELQGHLDATTWQAIDAVRSIGNIGAHMEKDIDLIIDVEPGEAELLIGLIETLLEEWYVRRYEREERMQKVINAAGEKAKLKAGAAIPPQIS